jgi:hypothetical protein
MKYTIGDKVRKIKGYKYEGIIISGGYKLNGERVLYSVEVEKKARVTCLGCEGVNEFEQNCGGMVHIFAEDDIELIK